MPLLTFKRQLAGEVEGIAGTAPPGFPTIGQANTLVESLTVALEVDPFTRDFVRETSTAIKDVVGKQSAAINFRVDLKGTTLGTHAAGAPNFSKYLRGCGFEEFELSTITIGAVTDGPFRAGEIVSQAVSAATAVVAIDTHNGTTELIIDKASIVGTINNSGEWTGDETTAAATPTTTESNEGFGWRLKTIPLKEFDLTGAWSTAPTAGDVIEGATSGARMIYVADISTNVIAWRDLRGTFSVSETLDNLTSGVSSIGTLANPTREEYTFADPLTLQVWEDGVAIRTVGSRGTMTMEFEVNRPTKMAFEFRGILSSATDVVNLTGILYDFTTPPLWAGAVTGFADNENAGEVDTSDEQDPCLRTLSLALGASLADRECAGATGGFKEVIIANREGTFSMDPEATLEADIAFLGLLRSGQVQRLRVPVGSNDGNRFTVFCPGLQIQAAPTGDRDGLLTRELTGKMTGGNLNNLLGTPASLSTIGGDNELVILYHTS